MKKVTQLAVALFVVAIAFSSCKKCETCTVYGGDGVMVAANPEQCDKDGRENSEASAKAAVELLQMVDANAYYECI